jgi:outer membrane protein X
MKKIALMILLTVAVATASNAQTPIHVGGFLGYGSDEIKRGNFGFIAEFMLNDKMAISPDLTFYFPKDENNYKLKWYEINGNFNYYFVNTSSVGFYGLAGLNFTHARAKFDNGNDSGNGEVGINLGFGLNFIVNDKIQPFTQMKYVVSDYDHASILFGVKVRVN